MPEQKRKARNGPRLSAASVAIWVFALAFLALQLTMVAVVLHFTIPVIEGTLSAFLRVRGLHRTYLGTGTMVTVWGALVAKDAVVQRFRDVAAQWEDRASKFYEIICELPFVAIVGCFLVVASVLLWPLSLPFLLVWRRRIRRARAALEQRESDQLRSAVASLGED